MTGYLLMALGIIAAVSAFLFRSPMLIILDGLVIEVWMMVLVAGLIAFSSGARFWFFDPCANTKKPPCRSLPRAW